MCTVDSPAITENCNWDSPIEPATFYEHYFRSALRAVGLPVSNPGEKTDPLRRASFSTICGTTSAVRNLNAGVPFRLVSEWMSHSCYTIILNIYGGKFR